MEIKRKKSIWLSQNRSLPKKTLMVLLLGIVFFQCHLIPPLDRTLLDISTFNFLRNIFLESGHSVAGEVRGLIGSGLRIQLRTTPPGSNSNSNPNIEDREITQNGRFSFRESFPNETGFEVVVMQQPQSPTQICEVAGGTGVIQGGAVNSVLVQCGESLDVAQPVFSPPPGEYSNTINVTITSTTLNNQIYWTLDGSDPACDGSGSSAVYTAPVNISQPSLPNVTLRAIACVEDRESNLQVGNYRITYGILAMPTSSLATSPPAFDPPQTTILEAPAAPPGVTVHYTTNGTTPTCASPTTPNPVNMTESTTIRAISCHPDYTHSNVAVFTYLLTGTVAVPTYSHYTDTYNNDVSLILSVATPGAVIRYELTTDGSEPSDPDCTTSPVSGPPIVINMTNTRIKARGCLTDWNPSAVSEPQIYTLQVATPTLNPTPPMSITTSQVVSASTTTASSTIYYRTDGTAPDCTGASTTTTPPNLIAPSDGTEDVTFVRAIACKPNYIDSIDVGGSYTPTGTLDPPTFSVTSGTYPSAQSVSLNLAPNNPNDANTTIHYTTDGSTPTCASPSTPNPVNVSVSATISAISCRTNPYEWIPSNVASANYTITGSVANPVFNPVGDTYNNTQSVNITSPTLGATIRWSSAIGTDPTPPNCSTGNTALPIPITQNDTRILAIACLTDWNDSSVVPATYYLRPDMPVPDILPGTYGLGQTINFTSSTGATIHRISGPSPLVANPTCGDPTGSITVPTGSGSVEVKAIACRNDFQESLPFSGIYTIGDQVPMPSFGAVNQNNQIEIEKAVFGSAQNICYRIDGTPPACSDTPSGTPDPNGGQCAMGSFLLPDAPNNQTSSITNPTTVRAVACSEGNYQSNVAEFNFTIDG
ncbi:MAG: chitobiase/beta-hexosaminidase C-terminal domain-containing protein, partial [Leptospira sp.]|nr:chitobiase/beta-hexosaminidase C-terminal domain-containing protein [Leptospira sp.]